jgi:hypothetical protein
MTVPTVVIMPKKKAVHAVAAKRRRRAPWGKLLRGKPIERHIFIGDERIDSDDESLLETQYFRMTLLLPHYGIVGHVPLYPKGLADRSWWCWYELALAIASELDDSLKIVARPPRGKTAARWRGPEGAALIRLVDSLRKVRQNRSIRWCLREVQQKIFPNSYGRMPLDQLGVRYHEAKRHHRTTKRARNS